MKKILLIVMAFAIGGWTLPKPMESIENYNVLMVHGALGSDKGFDADDSIPEAFYDEYRGSGHIGKYGDHKDRVTYFLSRKVFEEPDWDKSNDAVRASSLYAWRSFTNPANSSKNNAVELGDRTWNKDGKFGKRRALVEEAQEVKAGYISGSDTLHGQEALDSMRNHPDLYHQLASRYILVGHSMGGVVSREYVQNSDYYHGEVDKVVTLDSPHEGTGALNMQLAMQMFDCEGGDECYFNESNAATFFEEGITNWVPLTAAVAIAAAIASKDIPTSRIALYGLLASVSFGAMNYAVGGIVESFLENYRPDDPLVHYVDPNYVGENINVLKTKENISDSLPMFRLLAMENSMTFTDPNVGVRSILSVFVPDAISVPIANMAYHINLDKSFGLTFANSMTALYLGFLSGANLQGKGSSLVETEIGLAKRTKMLMDPTVDVKRSVQNAAYNSSNETYDFLLDIYTGSAATLLAANLIPFFSVKASLKTVITIAFAAVARNFVYSAVVLGTMDLIDSHMFSIDTKFKDWMLNDSVHVYEDFLYEKPFVNLALFDSRTADSLAKNPSASLNPSCYYGVDGGDDAHLCEIGLYGTREPLSKIDTVCDRLGNVIGVDTTLVYNALNQKGDSVYYGSFKKDDFSAFKKGQFRFKAESDWYKVGVKMDRWDRVDGLKPDGSENPGGVPIRHVDRFAVPDVVVDGFIEKYSFVVDDLMPHRMRQIKMTFNSNEEVAWECDITKAEDDPRACAVYMRRVGGKWGGPVKNIGDSGYVAHPIKKNGRFDFNARDYFVNLSDIQKDNQNTVMITMVNKIEVA